MDVIVTFVSEFIWTTSCALVNTCLGFGFHVVFLFIGLLSIILASAFYKYMNSYRRHLDTNQTTIDEISDDETADDGSIRSMIESDFRAFIQHDKISLLH